MNRVKRSLIVSLGVLAAGGAAAGAIAATNNNDPKQTEQSILNDAAQRLNVSPDKLRQALGAAEDAQLDQAVKDGKLTQAQADAIKAQRQKDGRVLGMPGGGPHGFGGRDGHGPGRGLFDPGTMFDAAAKALGLSSDELRQQLQSGKSFSDIAKAQNKSLDDVKAAVKKAVSDQLDQAVKDGKITSAQRDRIASRLDDMIDHFAAGPGGGPRFGPRHP